VLELMVMIFVGTVKEAASTIDGINSAIEYERISLFMVFRDVKDGIGEVSIYYSSLILYSTTIV